jgi:hypothetical protein
MGSWGLGLVFEGGGAMGVGAFGGAGAGVAVGTASSPIFTIDIQYKLTSCIYYINSVLINCVSIDRLLSTASSPSSEPFIYYINSP